MTKTIDQATQPEVPASLVKLEKLNLDRMRWFGYKIKLSDRIKELMGDKRDSEERLRNLQKDAWRYSPTDPAYADFTKHVQKSERSIAVLKTLIALLREEESKMEDCHAPQLYDKAKEHLQDELKAWGVQ